MARLILPSFWDRLKSFAPEASIPNAVTVKEYEAAVLRDIQMLLNEWKPLLPPGAEGFSATILGYGLPSLTNFDASSEGGLTELALVIQEALRDFETRLQNIVVTMDTANGEAFFRIQADLRLEPYVDKIQFRAVLETGGTGLIINPPSQ